MGAPPFAKRFMKQTLVHWANPVSDGYNGWSFDDPVEIKGRCEYAQDMVITDEGDEVLSKAHVYLDTAIQEGEYLYLGSLDDLDSDPDPMEIAGAMRIIAYSVVPSLYSPNTTLTKAFLNKPYFNR
jgi:hypothetical protein